MYSLTLCNITLHYMNSPSPPHRSGPGQPGTGGPRVQEARLSTAAIVSISTIVSISISIIIIISSSSSSLSLYICIYMYIYIYIVHYE